jgi:hypothetical protein
MGDRRLDVLIVGLVIFAFDREGRNTVVFDERRRDLILRAERVGGAEPDIGSAGLERFHQVCGFGRHVEAGRDTEPSKGLLSLKSFLDQPQHRHGGFGPFNFEFALVCQLDILHVVFH